MSKIIGISAFYHDSAAALIVDGKIIAAAQEERFSRKKNTSSFPINAIKYCLDEANLNINQIDYIAFYEKPRLKFHRFIKNHIQFFPNGLKQFIAGIKDWVYTNSNFEKKINSELKPIIGNKSCKIKVLYVEHHLSHAASTYYCSNFEDAAILTIDGVGELSTTTLFHGSEENIIKIKEIQFPDSIGLLYSSFTYFLGFKVNSGEYKLMGLAPYGDIKSKETSDYIKLITENIIDVKEDGSFKLNMKYFQYHIGFNMIEETLWEDLFGIKRRDDKEEFNQRHCNLALAIQNVTESIILKLIQEVKKITKSNNICLAGGVALNCVANGKILNSNIFKNIYIQPAAGDAGGAIGAALAVNYLFIGNKNNQKNKSDIMYDTYLGPHFNDNYILNMIKNVNAKYIYYENFDELIDSISNFIVQGKIIGWFQGRMEFGPRALGNRSILADPRASDMQMRLNISIKKREGFRPFAPAVLNSRTEYYFNLKYKSPYMQFVAQVADNIKLKISDNYSNLNLREKLYTKKSLYPAITHVDFSARIQTVNKESNERFWKLLQCLHSKYDLGLLINTSFNVRGEPIVCSPEDAYNCFMNTEIDYLVIENFIFDKKEQLVVSNNITFEQD